MSSKQEVIGNNYFEKNGFGISIYLSAYLPINQSINQSSMNQCDGCRDVRK